MEIYNYDENGLYVGRSEADESPLEPDTYLIPALSTDKAPPIAKDGFELFWNETAWEYRETLKEKPEQPNEYSVWDEASWSYIEDTALKEKYLLKLYDGKLQEMMNEKAQAKGYDNIQFAALRAALINSPFHAEGLAFAEWMDNCNAKGYEILEKVKNGEIELPTVEEFLATMPELVLP